MGKNVHEAFKNIHCPECCHTWDTENDDYIRGDAVRCEWCRHQFTIDETTTTQYINETRVGLPTKRKYLNER